MQVHRTEIESETSTSTFSPNHHDSHHAAVCDEATGIKLYAGVIIHSREKGQLPRKATQPQVQSDRPNAVDGYMEDQCEEPVELGLGIQSYMGEMN
jgi:hypothetical protein